MDHTPECKINTIQLLKENIIENLCYLQLDNDFLHMMLKAQFIEEQSDKFVKDSAKRMKKT